MRVLFGSFFHNLQLLQIGFTQRNSCCISIYLQWNICWNQSENRTSFDLVTVIGSAYLLITKLDTKVLTIMFTVKCRGVISIWKRSPIFVKHVSLQCLLFNPHQTNVLVEYRSPIKKMSQLRPVYLRVWLAECMIANYFLRRNCYVYNQGKIAQDIGIL